MAVLAYSQVGYYFIIRHSQSVQKGIIKEKILRQLKDDELEIISLTDNYNKIYWEEEGKEFFYNGAMYDVVKTKTINNKVMLYCINDKKEKNLIDDYNLITKHNSSSDKKGKNTFDSSVNLFVIDDEKKSDVYFTYIKNNFSFRDIYLPKILIDNLFSPPKA